MTQPNNLGFAALARDWLGTPYRHQASNKHVGADCLGLVRGVWREAYGDEPWQVPPYERRRRRPDANPDLLAAANLYFEPAAGGAIEAGDLLLFRISRSEHPAHCAIAAGDDAFIHAIERLGVVEGRMTRSWRRRLRGVFAFPQPGGH